MVSGASVTNGEIVVVSGSICGSSIALTTLSYLILFSLANFSAYESFGQWITSDWQYSKAPLWIEVRLAGRVISVSAVQYPNDL